MEVSKKGEKETMQPIERQIDSLIKAAQDEEWDEIDEDLIPELWGSGSHDVAAAELLLHVGDKDPNIRDVVATALSALQFTDTDLVKEAVDSMFIMATSDPEKFPAGRAAVFLLLHQQDVDYREKIETALEQFKRLVVDEGWSDELVDNIPQLKNLLQG